MPRKGSKKIIDDNDSFRSWQGFPSDGVWLVENHGSSARYFSKLGPLPEVMLKATLEQHRDTISKAILDHSELVYSIYREQFLREGIAMLPSASDVARAIIDAVAEIEYKAMQKKLVDSVMTTGE